MKHLPCSKCGLARLPDGNPYGLSAWRTRHPIQYKCACGRINRIDVAGFHALPTLSTEEAYQHGIIRWNNIELSKSQQEDFKTNTKFTPSDLVMMQQEKENGD